jgi:hypothetical protein
MSRRLASIVVQCRPALAGGDLSRPHRRFLFRKCPLRQRRNGHEFLEQSKTLVWTGLIECESQGSVGSSGRSSSAFP